MKKSILFTFFLAVAFVSAAQDFLAYQKQQFIHNGDTLPYRILLPENYDTTKKYPLILFLHGSGERGNDNEKQLTHGAKFFLLDSVRKKYPAIIVFPQCATNSFWSNVKTENNSSGKRIFSFSTTGEPTIAMKLAQGLLYDIMKTCPVAKKQVFVAGLSMGGMGTFEIVSRNPKLFAAAIPICGGANPAIASKLKKAKWWVFHGAKDDVVLPENSEIMVEALKKVKASVRYTLYPNANHNSWDSAFAEPNLLQWLFGLPLH